MVTKSSLSQVPQRRLCRLVALLLCATAWSACRPQPVTHLKSPGVQPKTVTSGWRGDGSGHFPKTEPPRTWGPTEHVAWKTPMPSWGNASPSLAGDRLFVTAEPTTLIAVSTRDGAILWQWQASALDALGPKERDRALGVLKEAARAETQLSELRAELQRARQHEADPLRTSGGPGGAYQQAQRDVQDVQRRIEVAVALRAEAARFGPPESVDVAGSASPTPVNDGIHVWSEFANMVVACHTMDGHLVWSRLLRHEQQGARAIAASPVLVAGRLILTLDRVVALDPNTGADVWELQGAERSWATPAVARIADTDLLITTAGTVLRAFDGRVLARSISHLAYTSPVVDQGNLYFVGTKEEAQEANVIAEAFALPQQVDLPFEPRRLWQREFKNRDAYCPPLLVDGHLLEVDRHGNVLVLHAQNGQTEGQFTLPRSRVPPFKQYHYASPALAGGEIHLLSASGASSMLSAKPPFEVRRTNQLDDSFRASPVYAGRRLYLRGMKWLYAIDGAG